MKQSAKVLSLILILLAAAACGASPQEMEGSWILAQLNGEDALPGVLVTFAYQQDEVSGSGGCNTYSGNAAIKGAQIELNELSMTLMACLDDEINRQETDYFIALNHIERWNVTGDRLTLSGTNVTLIFERAEGGFFGEPGQ